MKKKPKVSLEEMKFRFLKNSHILKPLTILALIAIPIYGYLQTQRIWDNLEYINRDIDVEIDSLIEVNMTAFKHLGPKEKKTIEEKLKEKSRSWPLSLLTEMVLDTVTNEGILRFNDSTYITYLYEDQLVLNHNADRFIRQFRMDVQEQKIADSDLDSIYNLMDSRATVIAANNSVLIDSTYLLYLDRWKGTDSIIVKVRNLTGFIH